MRQLIGIILLAAAAPALAETAHWTGRSHYATTRTYTQGLACEYGYSGHTFWRTFAGAYCPSDVQI